MNINLSFILFSLIVVMLTACNQDAQTKNAIPSSSIIKSTGQSSSKPHAAIDMNFEVLNDVVLGKVTEIKLNFKVGLSTVLFKIDLSPDADLELIDTPLQYQYNNVPEDALKSINIHVIPTLPGQHVINLTASIDVDGMTQTRAFVIPLETNTSANLKISRNSISKGGKLIPNENIISMPASETISTP